LGKGEKFFSLRASLPPVTAETQGHKTCRWKPQLDFAGIRRAASRAACPVGKKSTDQNPKDRKGNQ